MFKVGERVVYPGHGVAVIAGIIVKKIGQKAEHFFELKFVNRDVTALVPTENAITLGMRSLCSIEHVAIIYTILEQPYVPVCAEAIIENWNKRSKKYMGKMRTGDLKVLGAIYHHLRHIGKKKELSFGEKNVLIQTENMLAEEIALVENIAKEAAVEKVRSLIRYNP
jgi:CarD family transcriptional regulator